MNWHRRSVCVNCVNVRSTHTLSIMRFWTGLCDDEDDLTVHAPLGSMELKQNINILILVEKEFFGSFASFK